jgi:tetratricopeptide (TPR) repeat protein
MLFCINTETKKLKDGTIIANDPLHEFVPAGHHFVKINFSKKQKELDALWKKTKDIDYLSDCGVVYILQGKYAKAKSLYLNIEKLSPNRYSTASNLGTVYELMGQNDSAIVWIKKAVAINPASHKNSEWIHTNILLAKLKGGQYYTSENLIGISFGNNPIPQTSLSKDSIQKIGFALFYQLNERMSFIKSKDKIIAQLLFDLGNIYFLSNQFSIAQQVYQKAREYGYTQPLLQTRMAKLKELTKKI